MDHTNAIHALKNLLLGCSPLHMRLRTMETLINMGVRRHLGGDFLVYGHKKLDRNKIKLKRQEIKDRLVELDHLILIDRAQHGRVGNVGNVARAFYAERNHDGVADILNLPVDPYIPELWRARILPLKKMHDHISRSSKLMIMVSLSKMIT